MICALLTVPAEAQVRPERFDTVADTWIGPSGNHPDDTVLRVSKNGPQRGVAKVSFDLDATVTFVSLDCNFWHNIEKAELVLELDSVSGCPNSGCRLRIFRDDDNSDSDDDDSDSDDDDSDSDDDDSDSDRGSPLSKAVRFHNGQTGEARFDVTADVVGLGVGDLAPTYRIEQRNRHGVVVFASSEAMDSEPPRIEVTNRTLPDETLVSRKQMQVFDLEMSYLEAGDPDSDNQFLLIHGMPSYSLMYRNVIPRLAEVGHVVAPDWIGTGFSSFPSPTDFDYRFDTQADHLAELVRLLGMTEGGRKLIVVIHEVGGLGGFHYATTHQDLIAGIAFYETWLDVCPPGFEGSATNPPPPSGIGVCQKDTLVPFDLFSLWETVIYPSEALTCAFFTPLLVSPATVQGLTFRNLSSDLLDDYVGIYQLTPDCSLIPGPLSFPRNIPVPVAGEPAASRQLYDDYQAEMNTWTVPKLLLVGDPGGGFNLVFDAQLPYVLSQYPNLDAGCIGNAGHFGPEDAPLNLVDVVLGWAEREGILED